MDTVEALDAMVNDIVGDSDGGVMKKSGYDDSSSDDDDDGGHGGAVADRGSAVGAGGREACREIAVDLEHHSFRREREI